MNGTEREIYIKYAYNKTFKYIWDVYMEFEYRVNFSDNEFDGLKTGECRFDYESWVKRLDITKKQMERAIKNLTEKDKVILQIKKGTRGKPSVYFLTRFEVILCTFEEKKKEKNEEQNKSHNHAGLGDAQEKNEEKNEEKKKEQSSKYINLSIISNNKNSAFFGEVIDHLNKKINSRYKPTTKNTQKHISARLNEGYTIEDFKTVIDKKCDEWLGTEFEKYLAPDTLFGSKFEKYLNQKVNIDSKGISEIQVKGRFSKAKSY